MSEDIEIIKIDSQKEYDEAFEQIKTQYTLRSIMWRGMVIVLMIMMFIAHGLFMLIEPSSPTPLNLFMTFQTVSAVVLLIYGLSLISDTDSFTSIVLNPIIKTVKHVFFKSYAIEYDNKLRLFTGLKPTYNEQFCIWVLIITIFLPIIALF